MRSWLQAVTATVLLTGGSAFAFPHARHVARDIATVAGSTGRDQVSIQFSSPCKGCFSDPDAEVALDLQLRSSRHECEASEVSLNGLKLVPSQWGPYERGNLLFNSKPTGQPSDVEVFASWNFTCLDRKTSLLSVSFEKVLDHGRSDIPSGFAVSFRQREHPVVLRLRNQPIQDAFAPGTLEEWIDVKPEQQLVVVPPSLEGEMRDLEEIYAQMCRLSHQYKQQEHKIAKMIKHDFQACHGMKCVLQTAIKKAPDAFALIKAHFCRHPKHAGHDGMSEQEIPPHVEMQGEDVKVFNEEFGPQHDELEPHPPPLPEHDGPPFEGEHPPPPPPPDHHQPPFEGEHPPPPPPEHGPPRHKPGHKGPPGKGEHPPPPPPEHHEPPFEHEHPPPPPPGHHGPPSDDKGPPGPPPPPPEMKPPHSSPPFDFPHHGPPSDHPPHPWDRHHPPHFGHHRPHHRPLLITIIAILLLLIFIGTTAKFIRGKSDALRKQRKRQNRRARCEERRNRVVYRCAAAQHRWSRWWSQFRQPESTDDYDEKRERILSQEGALEDVMQNEIRDLRRAHELVGEIMRAEEGRQRMYHEANFGSGSGLRNHHEAGESSSASNHMGMDLHSSLPAYQAPPPSDEAELEGEMTVVDGFRYTPSNTGSTPDSSVIDCNSRISFETGEGSAGGLKDF